MLPEQHLPPDFYHLKFYMLPYTLTNNGHYIKLPAYCIFLHHVSNRESSACTFSLSFKYESKVLFKQLRYVIGRILVSERKRQLEKLFCRFKMYIFHAQFIIFSSLKRHFYGFASFLRLLSHYVITLVQNLANGVTKTNKPTPIGEDLNVFHLTLTLVSQLLALLKAMEIK